MDQYVFNQNRKDAFFYVAKALPAAGAAAELTSAFDLGTLGVLPTGSTNPPPFAFQITLPALPTQTGTDKYIDFRIMHCDTLAGSYVTTGLEKSVPGVAATGTPLTKIQFRPPPDIKRFVKLEQAETAAGADVTAISSIFELVFD